ncbi:MAG: Ig-like domain-containing protein [Armatimonadota bacterium]
MRCLTILVLLLSALMAWALPSEVWVDATYTAQHCDHTFGVDGFNTIQDGIDHVGSYGIVHVAVPVYFEQVTIDRPVQLIGNDPDDGGPVYVILPQYNVTDPNNPIYLVDESEVTIQNIIFTDAFPRDSPPIQLDDPPMDLLDDDPPPVDAADDTYGIGGRGQEYDIFNFPARWICPIANDFPYPTITENPDDIISEIFLVAHTNPKHGEITRINWWGGFTYIPDPNFPGIDYFTYTISDGVTQDTATIYLEPDGAILTNRPSFTPGPDVTVKEDEYNENAYNQVWATDISSGEGETDPLQFIVTHIGGATDLFIESPTIDTETGNLYFVTNPEAYGVASYSVVLTDGGWYVPDTPHTLTITVNPVNDQPSFNICEEQPVVVVGLGSGTIQVEDFITNIVFGPWNEDQQISEFVITNDNPGIFAEPPSIDNNGVLSFTPSVAFSGIANLTIRLRDDGGTDHGGVDLSEPNSIDVYVVEIASVTVSSGATQTNVIGAKNWATVKGSGNVIVEAEVLPTPPYLPPGLISWEGGEEAGITCIATKNTSEKKTVRASCGTSSDYVDIYILWATITYYFDGDYPDDDARQINPAIVGYGEHLGETIYDNGSKAAGVMVAEATITPIESKDIIKIGWNIGRWKYVRDFVIGYTSPEAGLWDDDDDPGTDDTSLVEFLNLVPDEKNCIYDTDGPTIHQIAGGDSNERNCSFYQWVSWNSVICSDFPRWHWQARFKNTENPKITFADVGPSWINPWPGVNDSYYKHMYGTITLNGNGLAGVSVTAGGVTSLTDAQGNFHIITVPIGNNTVTAEKDGFTFNNNPRQVTVPNDSFLYNVNFTATQQ